MLTKFGNALYKYYITTWVFFLILFKRPIPKWMQKDLKEVFKDVVYPLLDQPTERLSK